MLTGILKKRLRFDGFVMSDWGGTHSTIKAAKAGLDMEMGVAPGRYFGSALKSAVQSVAVPVSRLNDMVLRILRPMFRLGIFEHPHAPEPQAYSANVETPDHIALARRVSEEGTVLLKNRGGKPALSNARLARNQHHLPFLFFSALPAPQKQLDFLLPPDQRSARA